MGYNNNIRYIGEKIGVGTTSPDEKLDVVGNGLFSGTLTASNLSGTNTGDQVIPDNTDFVDLSTNQTVSGVKTFNDDIYGTRLILDATNSTVIIKDGLLFGKSTNSSSIYSETDKLNILKTNDSLVSKSLSLDFSLMSYPDNVLLKIPNNDGTIALTSDISGFEIGTGLFISDTITAPTSNTDIGIKGEVRVVGTDRYECITTNTWVKSTVVTTF